MSKKEKVFRDFNAEHFAMAIVPLSEHKRWQAVGLVIRDMTKDERRSLLMRLKERKKK